jgi:hypothetical protein
LANISPPLLPLPAEMALCPKNISQIHEWIHDCEINHLSCKKSRKGNLLPTRFICVKSDLVYLIETEHFSETERQLVLYLALSHCWGPEKPGLQYKTTSQNIQSRLRTMVLDRLPQNIRDAISCWSCLGCGVSLDRLDLHCSRFSPRPGERNEDHARSLLERVPDYLCY